MERQQRTQPREKEPVRRPRKQKPFVYRPTPPDIRLARATAYLLTKVNEIESIVGQRKAYDLVQKEADRLATKYLKRFENA